MRLKSPLLIQERDSPTTRSGVWAVVCAVIGLCFCACGFSVMLTSYVHTPNSRAMHGCGVVFISLWAVLLVAVDKVRFYADFGLLRFGLDLLLD